jgi:glycosyltransferase involved in cell wall biosynthesis
MQKIVIIHIITRLELGGAQQNTLYTVTHLDPGKFETFLICGRGGVLDSEAAVLGDHLYFIPQLRREIHPFFDLIALFKMTALLRQIKKRYPGHPLIVHTHSSKGGILGRFSARLAGVSSVVHTFHGFGFHDFQNKWVKRLYIFMENLTGRLTRQLIFVSKDNADKALKLGLVTGAPLIIRSGISFKGFKMPGDETSLSRKELNLPVTTPLVTMVACFKPQKAPLDFVEMAGEVIKKVSNVHFLMIGDGELRPAIESRIKTLQLTPYITLLGWRRDVPQWLASSNVFVLSSLWEGLPRVLIEARLSGIPIVTTDIEGADEMVEEGKNGFIVRKKDYLALGEKVLYLLQNPAAAKKMGEAGRSVPVEFDIDEMVRRQEQLYLELAAEDGKDESPFIRS